jgi:ankyrin repeat protein
MELILLDFIDAGNVQGMEMILNGGADVNRRGGRFGHVLSEAATKSQLEIASTLLQHGAYINPPPNPNPNFQSPLLLASSCGHMPLVRLFLQEGAEINSQSHGNALAAATLSGHGRVVTLLLQKGADVNYQSPVSDTFFEIHGSALHAAAEGGHKSLVELFIQRGVNVNARGGLYGSALRAAAYHGHESIAQLLLEEGAEYGSHWDPVLREAASGDRKTAIKLLLQEAADDKWRINGCGYPRAHIIDLPGDLTSFIRQLPVTGPDG